MRGYGVRRFGGALLAAALLSSTAIGAEQPLTLKDAILHALEKNEDLIIEHESVTAAEAEVKAASGVYDPVLGVDGTWGKQKPPINSAFSTTPAHSAAPAPSRQQTSSPWPRARRKTQTRTCGR